MSLQKLSLLLDEVQMLIDDHNIHFILSGSSARSLKRKGVNLLGGRAHGYYFHPFVSQELGDDFDLLKALNYGSLPPIYLNEDPEENLNQYVGIYLAEEIAFEGFIRQLPAFSRFLEVVALCNGQQINFTTLALDAELKRSTVVDWFDVLKDTLVLYELPIWGAAKKRKAVNTSKYYFFDLGAMSC